MPRAAYEQASFKNIPPDRVGRCRAGPSFFRHAPHTISCHRRPDLCRSGLTHVEFCLLRRVPWPRFRRLVLANGDRWYRLDSLVVKPTGTKPADLAFIINHEREKRNAANRVKLYRFSIEHTITVKMDAAMAGQGAAPQALFAAAPADAWASSGERTAIFQVEGQEYAYPMGDALLRFTTPRMRSPPQRHLKPPAWRRLAAPRFNGSEGRPQ